MCFSSKVKAAKPPAPSAGELRAQNLASAAQELAISEAGFDIVEGEGGKISLVKRQPTQEEAEEADFDKALRQRIRETLLGEISPETRELVGREFESARSKGEEDIRRFGIELAGTRGLNLSDTPVAKEVLGAQGRLTEGLRGAEAGALLSANERQRLFSQSLREFQETLRQRAFTNRLNLAGQSGALGLGLGQLRASTFKPFRQPSQLSQVSQGFEDIGKIVQSAGGILKTGAGIGSLFF